MPDEDQPALVDQPTPQRRPSCRRSGGAVCRTGVGLPVRRSAARRQGPRRMLARPLPVLLGSWRTRPKSRGPSSRPSDPSGLLRDCYADATRCPSCPLLHLCIRRHVAAGQSGLFALRMPAPHTTKWTGSKPSIAHQHHDRPPLRPTQRGLRLPPAPGHTSVAWLQVMARVQHPSRRSQQDQPAAVPGGEVAGLDPAVPAEDLVRDHLPVPGA